MMPHSLSSLLAFIAAIGLLVVVHEFGHYWVARRCGVKVLRFAVGFGPVLWSRRFGADQTEWALCAIPLGGYVKMLDEREAPVDDAELARAFNRQTLLSRSLVVAAGPLANLLLAWLLYTLLYVSGFQDLRPLLGEAPAGSVAAQAGVEEGDTVLQFGNTSIDGWESLRWAVLAAMVDGGQVPVRVKARDGQEDTLTVDLQGMHLDDLGTDPMRYLGFMVAPPRIPPVVGKVIAGAPAERAGFQPGDRIVAINDEPVTLWRTVAQAVAAAPEQTLRVDVMRGEAKLQLHVTPQKKELNERIVGQVGIAVEPAPALQEAMFVRLSYPLPEALPRALHQVWDTSIFTLRMLGRMVIGELSLKNISGPVTIADYAGQSARLGLDYFLKFLALISISIGVLNLLPVPVLDGGHLMYYLAEFIYRKPLPELVFEVGQRIGLAILVMMMGIAVFNDLQRQFFG